MKNNWHFRGVVLFFSLLAATAIQAQNNLIITFHDGSRAGSLLSMLDRITFHGSSMVLKKTDATFSTYVFSDIQNMTFGLYSGISDVEAGQNELAIYPNPATNYIQLKNAPQGVLDMVVYGLEGTVFLHKKLKDNMQQVDIHDLAAGLYLLKVNGRTFKFRKQ